MGRLQRIEILRVFHSSRKLPGEVVVFCLVCGSSLLFLFQSMRALLIYQKAIFIYNLLQASELFKKSGLGDADISTGEVLALKRRVLNMQSVVSWDELKVA